MNSVLDNSPLILNSAPDTPTDFPAWFAERQRAAWQRFLETPAPKRGDEPWRFASIKQLDFSGFRGQVPVPEDTGSLIERSMGLKSPAAKFIFVNDTLIEIESRLPESVICMPLSEALLIHPELVEQHFMRQDTRLGSAKWTALHESRLVNGLFVYVPDGVKVEGSIEAFHWISGERTAIFPHTLVVTGDQAKVRVIDYFQSENTSDHGLAIAVNDLNAGPGSELDYLAIQALNDHSKIVQVNDTGVSTEATTTGFILNTGCQWVRNESICRLDGEGAHSNMLSVSLGGGTQDIDQRTFQHHISPGAYSDLLYKNSLYGKSQTIFSGLIFVDEGAHRTDAYQTCRNLFMSDHAEAHSMPGLEINADDVKCSHGSTSSQISDDEIFYLCTRGIDPGHARQLIARGFSVEVIRRLKASEEEALVLRFLDAKFAQLRDEI